MSQSTLRQGRAGSAASDDMLKTIRRKFAAQVTDKNFSEILVGSAFSLAAQALAAGLNLVINAIIARVYGAEATGVLALMNSFLTLVSTFTLLGTGIAVLRFVPEHIARHSFTSAFLLYRKMLGLVTGASLGAGILLFFGSGLLADNVYSKPHLSFFFAITALFIVFSALADINTGALRSLQLIRTFALMRVVPAALMLTFLAAATILCRNPGNPVYAQLGSSALAALAGLVLTYRAFRDRMRPGDAVLTVRAREILDYSLPMLISGALAIIAGQTSLVLLGIFGTERDVGHFAMAVKLATLTSFMLHAINSLATPKFSELFHTGRIDELFTVAKKSTRLIFWTTIPVLLSLVLFGKFILSIMFGRDFAVAYPAMVVLLVGQFVNACSGSTASFMNMAGHQKLHSAIIFFALVINIGLGLTLIPRFGILGAASAGAASLIFWNTYVLLFIKAKYGRTIGYFPLWSSPPAK